MKCILILLLLIILYRLVLLKTQTKLPFLLYFKQQRSGSTYEGMDTSVYKHNINKYMAVNFFLTFSNIQSQQKEFSPHNIYIKMKNISPIDIKQFPTATCPRRNVHGTNDLLRIGYKLLV